MKSVAYNFRMITNTELLPEDEVRTRLESSGIKATSQRVQIARLLMGRCMHVSADDVYEMVNADADARGEKRRASKATVYNTLGLFAEKGVVREVIADPSRIFYDANTEPHYHLYNVDTGELTDVPLCDIRVQGLPVLPEGTVVDGVEVIVRLRSRA